MLVGGRSAADATELVNYHVHRLFSGGAGLSG
jgi:hypothetical protein